MPHTQQILNKKRILIVEDEFIIAQDLASNIETLGYQVVGIAPDYDQAIAALEQGNIDLILLDIRLGNKKSGIDVAKVINERYHLPFIFITSNHSDEYLERIKPLHPSGFIGKPFQIKDVKAMIELCLYKNAFLNVSKLKKEKETLLEISSAFNAIQNRAELVRYFIGNLKKYFSFEYASMPIFELSQDFHYDLLEVCTDEADAIWRNDRIIAHAFKKANATPFFEQLLRDKSTRIIEWEAEFPDRDFLQQELPEIHKRNLKFALISYFKINPNFQGFFYISAKKPTFDSSQEAFFKSVTDLFVLALSNLMNTEDIVFSENKKKAELLLAKAISSKNSWDQRLEQVTVLLQDFVPFDMLVVNIEMSENKCPTYAFYRTGKATYEKLYKQDLLDITQLSQEVFLDTRRRIISTYEKAFFLSGIALWENNRNNVIKDRICKHFKFESNLIFPLILDTYGKVIFSFYARKDQAFSAEHIKLLNSFENTLQIVFDRSLALEEIKKLNQKLAEENKYLLEEVQVSAQFETIIGQTTTLKEVFSHIELVGPTDTTVLITGETGTGKELIANAIHFISTRKDKPLIKINCAALPAQLIESELFGHEKGSFTGAFERKVGKFEFAHEGSIFLDEIGELPLELQAKLLRVLQEKEFERIGGKETIKSDVRIIAATNRDLLNEVKKGSFRADLYYRLHVFPIHLPALRDRKADIPVLASFFASKYGKKLNKQIIGIHQESIRDMLAYSWPGNVRELENIIEQAVIVSKDEVLVLRSALQQDVAATKPITGNSETNSKPSVSIHELRTAKIEQEIQAIRSALSKSKGKVRGETGAAALLALKPTTLEAKMRKYGIVKEEFASTVNAKF